MKLTDLTPRWVGVGGPGITDAAGLPVAKREGVGISFDCPCGCGLRGYVDFENPLDGGPPHATRPPHWRRTGEDFKTLSLSPSIKRSVEKGGCGWHGWVTNGEVTGQVEP